MNQIQLFVGYKFQKSIGGKGKGSGEYNQVTGIEASGDSIFVFDATLGKVLCYSLSTNKVFTENTFFGLTQFTSYARLGGSEYFLYTHYYATKDPNASILFHLVGKDSLRPLNVKLGELPFRKSRLVVSSKGLLKAHRGKLFLIPPLANKLWIYDPSTDRTSSFDLGLEFADEKDLETVTNINQQIAVLEKIELPKGLFVANDRIIVPSFLPIVGLRKKVEGSRIRFYSFEGAVEHEMKIEPTILSVTDSLIMQVVAKEAKYPHEIHLFRWSEN